MAPRSASRISLALLAYLYVIVFPTSATSTWDRKSVIAKQGDDITVTCSVTGLGPFDPVRVVKQNGEKKIVVTENDNAKKPFDALTSRYVIGYDAIPGSGELWDGTLTINYKGIRGEDAGKLGCFGTGDEENAAFVRIKVMAPVEAVEIMALNPTGSVTVSGGGYVVLREGDNMGVACIATADGSLKPPLLTLYMDGEDVTSRFTRINSSNSDDGDGQTTLGVWSSEARAEYRSTMPDASFNEKNFTCVATMPKFDSVIASATMDIEYAPIITCPMYENYGQAGDSITISCRVKANPGSTVSWRYGDDKSRAEVLENDVDAGTILTEKPLNEDTVEISLTIDLLEDKHFTSYYLSAENDIDIADIRLELKEGAPREDHNPGYSHSSQEPADPQEVLGDKNSAPPACQFYLFILLSSTLILSLHL